MKDCVVLGCNRNITVHVLRSVFVKLWTLGAPQVSPDQTED